MTPQSESILELFRSTGAYLQGHFRLTSGLHSPEYLQCALVLQHPEAAEKLGRLLAMEVRGLAGGKIDAVVSPALGGVIIGHEVARALGTRFLFTERDAATGKMALRRGFAVAAGETAAVVEDVITTGGSTRDVVDALQRGGRTGGRRRDPSSTAAAARRTSERRARLWLRCRSWRIARRNARCAPKAFRL